MVSKTTKSIASRIPLDLYFQLQKEAEELNLNMKDYLLRLIEKRNQKQEMKPTQINPETNNEKPIIPVKPAKKKLPKVSQAEDEIIFPLF